MSRFTVYVTDDRYGSYKEEEAVLNGIDAKLVVRNFTDEDEAVRELADADGILVNMFPMTARVIASLTHCRVLSRYGVGFDNVDVEAATKKGIWVTRVPDYSLEDVSDQALAMIMASVRKIAYKDRKVREGKWNLHKDQPCFRMTGKVLGLVGYGAIARTLHRKVGGFNLSKVMVYDPFVKPETIRSAGGDPCDLETLLKGSDYVSVHVPLMDSTRGMIGGKQLSLMKKTAILVNTSRGPVLDEKAVAKALADGGIAGAGLDVFEKEPLPMDSPLRKLDNVILSDHAGWYSEESVVELKTKAARNIAEILTGKAPTYPVNKV